MTDFGRFRTKIAFRMIGQVIAQYRIARRIGGGGMGVVYEAEDKRLKRQVALKFLPEEIGQDSRAVERFQREARAASALNHPHICTIYDLGEHEGKPFIAMELMKGQTLRRRIGGGAIPLNDVLRLGSEIADALEAAHGQGIVHRDIKPANLFVTERGQLKVLDFGLAKMTTMASEAFDTASLPTMTLEPDLTELGSTMGTVAYMSPEQSRAEEVDARSDLFSLGVVLYEMATGRLPFTGTSQAQIFKRLLADDPITPSRINPQIPVELDRLISGLLEKDRELRVQSAAEVQAGLKRLLRDTESGQAQPESRVASASQRRRNLGRWWLGAVAAVVVVFGVFWFAIREKGHPEMTTTSAKVVPQTQPTVAVLPFTNLGSHDAVDYLRLAVPSEITTTLSRGQGISVRPFARSVAYQGATVDLGQAATELRVAHLITGQYFATGDEIQVTLEAILVADDSLLWRENLSIPRDNLAELGQQVADLVRSQLLPLLGAEESLSPGTLPTDSEAYELYLKSLALGTDPEPNQRGIDLLEMAVERDPGFAPAWAKLSLRLYYRVSFERRGADEKRASDAAAVRAFSLDPDLVSAALRFVVVRVELGDLPGAYDLADELVTRRPDSAEAHFARSYVLRYAGLVSESVTDCEVALKLDPTDLRWRSCGVAYRRLGDLERSKVYYALDAGSLFHTLHLALDHLSEGDLVSALAAYRRLPESYFAWQGAGRLLETFLEDPAEMEAATRSFLELSKEVLDAETLFELAAILASVGQAEAAINMLSRSVEMGFCAVDMTTYPPFSDVRDEPEFQRIHEAALVCQRGFLDYRAAR